jgi:hypothetical protein
MRPLGFLTGVVLGSAASIALVLLMVVLTLALAASRQPAAVQEYPGLLASAALFGLLAAFSGAAFVGLQRERPWRWYAQAAMWLWLAGITWYFWPAGIARGMT